MPLSDPCQCGGILPTPARLGHGHFALTVVATDAEGNVASKTVTLVRQGGAAHWRMGHA
jgi:hypothetical protein